MLENKKWYANSSDRFNIYSTITILYTILKYLSNETMQHK